MLTLPNLSTILLLINTYILWLADVLSWVEIMDIPALILIDVIIIHATPNSRYISTTSIETYERYTCDSGLFSGWMPRTSKSTYTRATNI
jgi:hypothetical protein